MPSVTFFASAACSHRPRLGCRRARGKREAELSVMAYNALDDGNKEHADGRFDTGNLFAIADRRVLQGLKASDTDDDAE